MNGSPLDRWFPELLADLAYRRLTAGYHRRRTREDVEGLRRDSVERCWCGGGLTPFRWHPSYGVCATCGCYVNRRPPADDVAYVRARSGDSPYFAS